MKNTLGMIVASTENGDRWAEKFFKRRQKRNFFAVSAMF